MQATARLQAHHLVLTFDLAGRVTPEDRVYAELRARIFDMRLRPGTIVPERILAAELGINRPLLHHALLRLQAAGLVMLMPRRGFCVTAPTVEVMREIYEIVGALEALAVRWVARQDSPILLGALQGAIEAQERALGIDDLDAWDRADHRFHELLREGSANRRAHVLFDQYEGQIQQARAVTLHLRPPPRLSTDDHHAILRAIRTRNEDEAMRAHAAHRQNTDAEMLDAIERYGDGEI